MQAYVEAQTDVTAYIFREESAIYASAGGVCAYIAEDGEKVSRGQDVAAVYSQAGDASVQERIRELNEKIDILEQSQGFTSAGSTELTRLDASISDGILDVIRSLEAGDPAAAQRGDTELLVRITAAAAYGRRQLCSSRALDEEKSARWKPLWAAAARSCRRRSAATSTTPPTATRAFSRPRRWRT